MGRAAVGPRAGYGQFCPVARGAELFAERWTPLILRELLKGDQRFCELMRGLPRISKNLLVRRLHELERAGVLERRPARRGRGHVYVLTHAGHELRPVVDALGAWGWKWVSRTLTPENLDPGLLMWFLRRRIRVENLPARRVVIRFEFRGLPAQRFWLVLTRPDVDLCYKDPGFDVDLVVSADLERLTRVYLGQVPLTTAIREGSVQLSGPIERRRAFHDWIGITPYASSVKSVSRRAA